MPGELLTSRTKGPLLLLSISTPATDKPIALAALTAKAIGLSVAGVDIPVSYTHLRAHET